jgi:integrase/recombinase XerD
VTHLRKRTLEELQRRNYSEGTTRAYLQAVQQFAVHFGKSPDKLGPDDLRSYQAYLLVERKLAVASVVEGRADCLGDTVVLSWTAQIH